MQANRSWRQAGRSYVQAQRAQTWAERAWAAAVPRFLVAVRATDSALGF
jgi:hypothetical protein